LLEAPIQVPVECGTLGQVFLLMGLAMKWRSDMAPEILYGVGALILLVVLVWVVLRGRLRSKRAQAISEEATREQYEEPERYDQARQDALEEMAKIAEEQKRRND
jgi:type VI protein secretion system component VasK